MAGPTRLVRTLTVAVTLAVAGSAAAAVGVVSAHDEIESSVPEHQAQLDDPISEVTIDFGQPVDGIEMALVSPDDEQLPGEIVLLSDTEAKLVFDELDDEGEYYVRYLAEEQGHLVSGVVSFVYGDRDAGGGIGGGVLLPFVAVSAVILGLGLYFTLRRHAALDENEPDDTTVPA